MQIFRMFLITPNFSCADIPMIIINTMDNLNNIISSKFIFQVEIVVEIEEQFDHSSKVGGQIGQTPLYHAFYWKCFKRLVKKCLS